MVSEAYLITMRNALHRSSESFDSEIKRLIEAARCDLALSGILTDKANDESDPLIMQAVTLYLRAEFNLEPDYADNYRKAYESLKIALSLAAEYTEEKYDR